MSKLKTATETFRRPSTLGLLFLVAGVLVLSACGGSDEPADEAQTPAQAGEAAQAQADAQAEARKREQQQRVDQAKREASRLRSEASSSIPGGDEELSGALDQLDQGISQAERAVGTDSGADSQLQRVDMLTRQAGERLSALQAEENAKRQELLAGYEAAVAEAGSLPADLILGLDGDIYLKYKSSVVEQVQQALQGAGFYAGSISGDLDADTKVSLGRYQGTHGLSVTGVPSPSTRKRLLGGDESDAGS